MFILRLFALFCFLRHFHASVSNFHMEEESAKYTTIGSIILSNEFQPPINVEISSGNEFFTINEKGEIQVASVIDLDTLCNNHKMCCGTKKCLIPLEGVINKDVRYKKIDAQIEITDKNDNKPTFSAPVQKITLSENAELMSTIPLEPAIDNDKTKVNKVQRYSLTEETQTFGFENSNGPALQILKSLDFEKTQKYSAVLEACDSSSCAKQTLDIILQDENDNVPQFDGKLYKIKIKENHPINTPVLKLQAVDKDSGQYGRVMYDYDKSEQDENIKETFKIDRITGEIVLQQKLSVDVRSVYTFKVAATDSDPKHKDTAEVTVLVEDVNNHKPFISFVFPKTSLSIKENSEPGLVAILSVSDKDKGNNGKATCRLSNSGIQPSFKLSLSNEWYRLNSTRSFDYEKEISVTATINCNDLGEPRLTSELAIPISILDVNEFTPEFDTSTYKAHIHENADPDSKVTRLLAFDKDGSANLSYYLDKHGSQYFRVDRGSGFIYTISKGLDREEMTQIIFQAFVEDSNIEPRRANATVKITIDDQNDNSPIISSKRYFEIEENRPAYHQLEGSLVATDADSGSNGEIRFKLNRAWGLDDPVGNRNSRTIHELTQYRYFDVLEKGTIKALNSLDRESYSEFFLEVIAFDNGVPSLSSTANITIKVLDVNDNSPQWTYPHEKDSIVNITTSLGIGEVVVQVRANDRDSGKNGKVQFILVSESLVGSSSSSTQHFSLNATYGIINVISPLTPGQYELKLRASDLGIPERRSETYLLINVYGADVAQLNFTIIIVMISATAVISVFLVIAIICVRRRPPQYSPPSGSDLTKDQLPPWAYPIDDQICQPISDNASNIYVPDNCQQDGVALHTFNQHPGRYCPQNDGIPRHPYELDGDSADSGRGGSEDDPGLHHHLLNGESKGRPFSPIQFHNRPLPGPGRGSSTLLRNRVASPGPNLNSANNCGCYILPEDGIIQSGQSPYPVNYTGRPTGLATPTNRGPLLPGQIANYGQMHPPPPAYDTLSLTRGATAKRPMVGGGSVALLDSNSGGFYLPKMNLSSESSNLMAAQPYGTVARTPNTRRASHDCPPVSGLPPIPPMTTTILPPMSIRPAVTQPATLNGNTSSSVGSLRGSPEPLPAPPKHSGSNMTPPVTSTGLIRHGLVNGSAGDLSSTKSEEPASTAIIGNSTTSTFSNSTSTFTNNLISTSTFSKNSVNKPLLSKPSESPKSALQSNS